MIPNYAVLIIILTTMFVAASTSALIAHGLTKSKDDHAQKQRFSFWLVALVTSWVTVSAILSYYGMLVPDASQTFPLFGALILGSAIVGNVLWTRSRTATNVLLNVPLHWLATIQIYRIVGVVFLLLAADGHLSNYFATTTGWGDILVGVTAPMVGYLLWKDAQRYRAMATAWCIVGIGDLLLVLYKALRTAPGPMQADGIDIETVIIGYFPFPFIPLLIVPISLILHVQMLRKMYRTAE